jgi:hypothetical protein
MNAKNLISRAVKRVNGFTVQNLSTDLVELSERDLKRVVGGGDPCGGGTPVITGGTSVLIDGVVINRGGTVTVKACTCQVVRQQAKYITAAGLGTDFIRNSGDLFL